MTTPTTQTEHSILVKALCKPGETILAELTAHDANLIHMAMGVSGESGELLDAVKKHTIYRKPIDLANVVEELGDLEYFMEGLRQELGIDREACLRANIDKLNKRYGEGKYSNEQAQARADKVA